MIFTECCDDATRRPQCTGCLVAQRRRVVFSRTSAVPVQGRGCPAPHPVPLLEAPVRKMILQMHTPARTSQCWSRQTPAWTRSVHLDAPGQWHGQQPVNGPGQPTPGVVKQDKSSGGSVDTTQTRSGPQRVRMCSGERPIGAAKGKQTKTMASCQAPPPVALVRPCLGTARLAVIYLTTFFGVTNAERHVCRLVVVERRGWAMPCEELSLLLSGSGYRVSRKIGQSEILHFPSQIHRRNVRETWRGCGKMRKI